MKQSDDHGERPRRSNGGEFTEAVERLEKTVQEIVDVTKGQLSDRAASLLNDTNSRLEAELRLRKVADEEAASRVQDHRRRSRHVRHRLADRAERVNPRSGRLYRDPSNEKIAGVCAGLARYFAVETWIVRAAALAGLFMLPGVVFPAYWIAYFVMESPPEDLMPEPRKSAHRERRERRRDEHTKSVRGERAEPFNPSRLLRHAGADFTEVELRLRRLESFVTSDQYHLHKELAVIERESEVGSRG